MDAPKNGLTIALVGPESSGKSTLCCALAETFKTHFVAEYARTYFEKQRPEHYTPELIYELMNQQLELETQASQKAKILFCDTSAVSFAVWSKIRFGYVWPSIEARLKEHFNTFTLVLSPDLPWVNDGIRENPLDLKRIFNAHINFLHALALPYGIVKGTGPERMQSALAQLQNYGPVANALKL